MKPEIKAFLKHFMIELLVYSVLVFVYFFLVLHFLGGWIFALFQQQREVYAGVALALILGQGIVLELLTGALLRIIRAGGDR
jgi:hypothetical protein